MGDTTTMLLLDFCKVQELAISPSPDFSDCCFTSHKNSYLNSHIYGPLLYKYTFVHLNNLDQPMFQQLKLFREAIKSFAKSVACENTKTKILQFCIIFYSSIFWFAETFEK